MDLASFGLEQEDILSSVLTNAPLTMKVPIIEHTVNYFSVDYDAACTQLLTCWKNIVWVVDVLSQSFTLPFPTHTTVVLSALEVMSRMLMCSPPHPSILENYDRIACLVMRHMTLLFHGSEEESPGSKDHAHAATLGASIWTTLGSTQPLRPDTWQIAVRVVLATTCHVLAHPRRNPVAETKYVLLSTLLEVLLRSGSTCPETWGLLAASLRGLLCQHVSIITQWSCAYLGVTTAIVPFLQHPSLPRPPSVKLSISWLGMPRSVRATTIVDAVAVPTAMWGWRAMYAIVQPISALTDSISYRIALDAIRDVAVLISSTYHWPLPGVGTDALMALYGPVLVRSLVTVSADQLEGRSSAVAAMCAILARHRASVSPKNLATLIAVLSTCCVEIAATHGRESVLLAAVVCNCGTLFTVPFPEAPPGRLVALQSLLLPLVCVALTGSKDQPHPTDNNAGPHTVEEDLPLHMQASFVLVNDGDIEQDDYEGSDGIFSDPTQTLVDDPLVNSTPPRNSRLKRQASATTQANLRPCVYLHNDEWLMYNAVRILVSLVVHDIQSQFVADILVESLKIPHTMRTQMMLIRAADVFFHHQIATTIGAAKPSQVLNLRRLVFRVLAYLLTPTGTWGDTGELIVVALRFLDDVMCACDTATSKFFTTTTAMDFMSLVITSLAAFLTNLRAVFFKGTIEAGLTCRLFKSAYRVFIECVLGSAGRVVVDTDLCRKLMSVVEIGTSMGGHETYEVREWATALQHAMLSLPMSSNICEDDFAKDATRARYFQLDGVRLMTVLECPGKAVVVVRDPYARWVWTVTPSSVLDNAEPPLSHAGERDIPPPSTETPSSVSRDVCAASLLASLVQSPEVTLPNVTPGPHQHTAATPEPRSDDAALGRLFLHSLGFLNWSLRPRFWELPRPSKSFLETVRALDLTPPHFTHVVNVVYVCPTDEGIDHWMKTDSDFATLIGLLGDVTPSSIDGVLHVVRRMPRDIVRFLVKACPLHRLPLTASSDVPLSVMWLHRDLDPNPNTQDTEAMKGLTRCDKAGLRERTPCFTRDVVVWGLPGPGVVGLQLPSMNEYFTTMLIDQTPCTVTALARMLVTTCIRTSHVCKARHGHTIPWLTRRRMLNMLAAPAEYACSLDSIPLSDAFSSLLS